MVIETLSPDLQNHEALKGFNAPDELGKSYADLHTKVSSGSIELLPEDLRKDPSLASFKTVGDVAKSYIETKKLVGTIKRPPATPKDYKFTAVDGLHPSVKTSEGFQAYLAEGAHKLGLAEDQTDGVHKLALGYLSTLTQQAEKTREEGRQKNEAALKQEWGADYDKNFNGVVRMLTKAGGEDLIKELAPALKNAPLALKAFARIAGLLSEDSINLLDGGKIQQPEGDEKEFNALREALRTNDPKHPLNDSKNPQHHATRERYTKLSIEHFKTK